MLGFPLYSSFHISMARLTSPFMKHTGSLHGGGRTRAILRHTTTARLKGGRGSGTILHVVVLSMIYIYNIYIMLCEERKMKNRSVLPRSGPHSNDDGVFYAVAGGCHVQQAEVSRLCW